MPLEGRSEKTCKKRSLSHSSPTGSHALILFYFTDHTQIPHSIYIQQMLSLSPHNPLHWIWYDLILCTNQNPTVGFLASHLLQYNTFIIPNTLAISVHSFWVWNVFLCAFLPLYFVNGTYLSRTGRHHHEQWKWGRNWDSQARPPIRNCQSCGAQSSSRRSNAGKQPFQPQIPIRFPHFSPCFQLLCPRLPCFHPSKYTLFFTLMAD